MVPGIIGNMRLTERQLNRTLLRRQLLVEREPVGVVEAVRRLVGLQAQQPAAPYLALWNRVAGFDPAELDAAFAEHRIVKATLLRITLHAVAVEDREVFHRAMVRTLRAARLGDARFTRTGLTTADADASVADLLTFVAEPRSNTELDTFFAERFPELPETGIWWALRSYAPLIHAPGPHPWSYGHRPAYLAAPAPRSEAARSRPTEPWSSWPGATWRRTGPPRRPIWPSSPPSTGRRSSRRSPTWATSSCSTPGRTASRSSTWLGRPSPTRTLPVPPRLLGMWDNALLAHTDRGRLIPAEHRATVIRRNGDVLPMLLVDGYVAGVWRPVEGGIEATAFRRLPAAVWEGLAAEAAELKALLADREPLVFGRYGHWWKTIDGVQVKVL